MIGSSFSVFRVLFVACVGIGLLAHCSATSQGSASDGGVTVQCSGAPTSPVARPICTVTSNPFPPVDAGPAVACATAADCADAGTSYHGCLDGKCAFDQCLSDSDCPSGQACGCANELGGNGVHFNQCIAARCRTNADCSAGGTCSPSSGSYCNNLTGFYCHSSADQCATDADCTCLSPGVGYEAAQCAFSPQFGHFVCQARLSCNG